MLIEHVARALPPRYDNDEELYHKDIGFPDDVEFPRGFQPVIALNYGNHAREEAMADRYGMMRLPHRVDLRKGQTIEIGVQGNVITKLVVRFSYDEEKDIIFVITLPSCFVKTVWANEKTDQHKTLNRSRYFDPKTRRPIAQAR